VCRKGDEDRDEGRLVSFTVLDVRGDDEDIEDDDVVEFDLSEPIESLSEDLDETAKAGLGFLKRREDEDSSKAGRSREGV
jgi:hypothetical protein